MTHSEVSPTDRFRAVAGDLVYDDTADHFFNGLLRLMHLNEDEFAAWLAGSAAVSGSTLERLYLGWHAIHPVPATTPAAAALLVPSIAESPRFGIAANSDRSLGWLVAVGDQCVEQVSDPPVYEEEYFEGDPSSAGGYGDYSAQSGWRMEKAHRQVAEMVSVTGLTSGSKVLDLGSGYGYFRAALKQSGYDSNGVEVSAYARDVAEKTYDLASYGGTLSDHVGELAGSFDVVTGFDFIEHVPDTLGTLKEVAACLHVGGYVGLKTPNLDCPEFDVFGRDYHSLKREHLWYFTPISLNSVAAAAGLEPVSVTTLSHLLTGFVGSEVTKRWSGAGRGADISAWYRKV